MAHPKILDMSGLRIGRWTVLWRDGNAKSGAALWACRCDCGTSKSITGGTLRSGATTGCVHCASRSHVTRHSGSNTRIYKIWANMKSRCGNPSCPSFLWYGGRGISVDPQWMDFIAFRDWAHMSGYLDTLTLDRIDNDLGYSPSNCRWASLADQSKNRRGGYRREDGILWLDIARANGINKWTFFARLRRGVPPEKASSRGDA